MDKKIKLECLICWDKKFYVSKTGCNHSICIDCLFHLKKMECPMCRSDLSNELPNIVKDYILKKKINNKNINNKLQLNDNYEFPPLS